MTVPVIARLNGVGGTQWRTDLALANRNSITQKLRLNYLDNSGKAISKVQLLRPYSSLLLNDAVRSFFRETDGKGPMSIAVLTEGTSPPAVISRTYAITSRGNMGSGLPADVDYQSGAFSVPGLLHNSSFRASIAVLAGPQQDVTAVFQLHRAMRGGSSQLVSRRIDAGTLRQWAIDELFPGQVSATEPMTVKVVLPQPGIAFGTLVDSKSSDSAVYLGKEPALDWIVPVIAHIPGRDNTLWSSSVTLWNTSTTVTEIELEYLPEGRDNSAGGVRAPKFFIGGYATYTLDDVLKTSFGVTDGKGALSVRASKPISVTSRVWTQGTGGGTIGNGVRAVHASTLSGGDVVLPGVRTQRGYRTNVGVVTGNAWARLHFRLFDYDGILLANAFADLPPRSLKQLSVERLFGSGVQAPEPAGSLFISSGEDFVAYLTVIDATSQDPVFVMSR